MSIWSITDAQIREKFNIDKTFIIDSTHTKKGSICKLPNRNKTLCFIISSTAHLWGFVWSLLRVGVRESFVHCYSYNILFQWLKDVCLHSQTHQNRVQRLLVAGRYLMFNSAEAVIQWDAQCEVTGTKSRLFISSGCTWMLSLSQWHWSLLRIFFFSLLSSRGWCWNMGNYSGKETGAGISDTGWIWKEISNSWLRSSSPIFLPFQLDLTRLTGGDLPCTLISFLISFLCQLTMKQRSLQVLAPSLNYGSTIPNLSKINVAALEQALSTFNIQLQMAALCVKFIRNIQGWQKTLWCLMYWRLSANH